MHEVGGKLCNCQAALEMKEKKELLLPSKNSELWDLSRKVMFWCRFVFFIYLFKIEIAPVYASETLYNIIYLFCSLSF